MKKLSTIFTLLALGFILLSAFISSHPIGESNLDASPTPAVVIEYTTPTPNVTYSFKADADGMTALDLLKNKADVVFEDTSQGERVFSVNGMKNTDARQWSLSVNGQQATKAAEITLLRAGDELTLVYEEI